MITIDVPSKEYFDERTSSFFVVEGQKLVLEHSLISISKWESKWKKPFLAPEEKTESEILDYIRCMTITKNVDPNIYANLTDGNIQEIDNYINDSMTATTFRNTDKGKSREIITSELIYYWMISQNIPIEFEKWHLNRLLTLIRVCSIKNSPPKKMSAAEIMRQNTELNNARRKALKTKG